MKQKRNRTTGKKKKRNKEGLKTIFKGFFYFFDHCMICKKIFYTPFVLIMSFYTIEEAFDAIRGHKSVHSFATGPAIPEPFISPLLFTITPALSSK